MQPSDGERARGLFPPTGDQDRAAILGFTREAPLLYGFWKYVKGLYKDAETSAESLPPEQVVEVLGTLIGRLDTAEMHAVADAASGGGLGLSYVTQMAATDRHLCVADYSGLHVLDISNAAEPRKIGSFSTQNVQQIAVSGDYLYFTPGEGWSTAANQVHILDVSRPENPRHVGQVEARQTRAFAVRGTHLFVVNKGGPSPGLQIFDVSNPVQPSRIGSISVNDGSSLALSGNYAYVGEQGGRRYQPTLHIIDVSNPAQPAAAGTHPVNAAAAVVAGKLLPMSTHHQGIQILDISNPAHPVTQRTLRLDNPTAVVEHRGWLYVAAGYSNLYPVDLTGAERPPDSQPPPPSQPPPAQTRPDQTPAGIVQQIQQALMRSLRSRGAGEAGSAPGAGGSQGPSTRAGDVAPLQVGQVQALAVSGDTLYVAAYYELRTYVVSDPAHPARMGERPSRKTFGYMKRRARRFLRRLADRNPDLYAQLAVQALEEAGRGRETLDLRTQWVSLDTLYGRSTRYYQQSHGRGRYVETNPRVPLRTREERAPQAWDSRPDLVQRLYSNPDLPWQTHETVLKILRANRIALPPAADASLARFLRSPSSLLRVVAAREAATRIESWAEIDPEVAAGAFFFSGGAARKRLAPSLSRRARFSSWAAPFADRLTRLVATWVVHGRISRRTLGAAAFLTEHFEPFIPSEPVFHVFEAMYLSGDPHLAELALDGVRTTEPAAAPEWLALLGRLPEDRREAVWQALVAGLREKAFPPETARQLVFAETEGMRESGWRLLRDLSVGEAVLTPLWEELLNTEVETPPLRSALTSAAALELLRRVRLDLTKLQERLTNLPTLVRLLPPTAFEALLGSLPIPLIFRLLAAASDEQWPGLREVLLAGLTHADRLSAFWKEAPDALGEDAEGLLQRRLLQDPLISESFLQVDDPTFVEITDPPFESVLFRWVTAHADLFPQNSPGLLTAATHPLPQIRRWGLERVREQGMDLPFALRLMESSVPPSIELGKSFFEAAPAGGEAEKDYALALCDSPASTVRAYGRDYIQRRVSTLPMAELVGPLTEHGDPEMQRFLADALLQAGLPPGAEPAEAVREFDRGVLRSRNQARRAKEKVKTRLQKEGQADTAVLLELARSGTPRDAEWALGELARRAMEGQQIEGFSVEGTAGV
jgi:hypothetical protein